MAQRKRPGGSGKPQTDANLLTDLMRAEKAGQPVQAVVFLDDEGLEAPSADQTEMTVRKVIKRAEAQTATRPIAVNVFRNLHSFALEAPAEFVRALLDDPAVRSARSNRVPTRSAEPPAKRRKAQ
jgi:hypothetical protein